MLSAEELDQLTDDEYDAELLIEYLEFLTADIPDRIDLGPPGSARMEGGLASDNEDAWRLVAGDPRFAALRLSPLRARMMTGGSEVSRAVWTPRLHPRDKAGKFASHGGGPVQALSEAYNDVPETQGTPRGKGGFGEPTGRETEDDVKVAAWRRGHPVAPPITKAEARDEARAVSAQEFQSLAREGLNRLGELSAERAPADALDRWWPQVKADTWAKVQQPWGGATIDAHTATPLPDGARKYALTVKPQGMDKVSVPEGASEAEFRAAMDLALARYRGELEKGGRHLGVFHDDDEGRIDIDPVLVVDDVHQVETIGAFTHAIGGAYCFADGNGYWPPYVDPALGAAA